ncbi:Putative disease resistance RPP13-like protein 1 [Dendrobium catenatum]|uniref:Disease resistance RPP13-like protein 1 n=1 Tax=Dendrobium catenatum TaxID=906689 RepID=A0A2I0V6N1_9ASPA|nr:Putative disease resistance RPP13-like protein 1 [Dendrobium catenatum]
MVTPINLLVSKVLETLFNMAKEELAMQLRLVDDVKKLQNTLERLECYLQDSEKKIIEDDSTKRWLNQINHAMYDIEDLLEEYDALKINNSESMSSKEVRSSSSSSTKVRFWLSVKISGFKKVASNHRIGVDLRRLNKQLNDEIKGQIPELSFMINFAPTGPVESQIRSNNRTTAVVVRSDIVGNRIQDDARRLIKLLTKDDDRDNPLVYAIVGMGGIGKTTLAKLVFDDHIIASRFQVNVWVSVSQNYNENDILRNIITSAGGDGKRCHNFDSLSKKVIDMVKDKRVFMVLDDVWETKRVWNDMLRILLKRGVAEGSRVLVTTRNEEVAAQMMAVHSQRVQSLPLEDGWSLLCKSAFPAWEQLEAKDDKWNLKDIGIELVKKCDGLPLAINAIGGMLSSQSRTRESWEFILKSSSWEVKGLPDEINSVLYISYQYLPRDIKRCFLYCSLFPKGRYFKIMNAKNLWIQEGLINDEKNRSSHDVAERYFRILVQRNLVILDRVYIEAAYFKMHDLVYSLSQFLTRNENLVATEEREILNSEFDGKIKKLRRLSFIGGHNETTKIQKKCLQEQVSLRTLLTFDKTIYNIDNDLFNHLRHLRILWLRGTKVTELPASLGSLKLLRYLNLSQTPIKELPITIQNLNALRILDVSECENLRNLPSCIMKLHHLCSLTTKGTALDHLPQGVGNLNKLQLLEFIVPLDKGIARESSTVKELETLTELRQLNLCKLERVLDSSQTKSASLKDKPHLKELILSCSERDSNEVCTDDSDRIEVVFEDLCPPVQLKILKITNYFGCKLPSWLGSRLFNIRFLKITGCSNCKKLDGLGLLPFLEAFYIEGASSIKNIGPEFYTNNNIENDAYQNSVLFRRMKLLSFENMDSWEEWSSLGNDIRVMPFLEVLQIYACPKLKSIPEEVLQLNLCKLERVLDSSQTKSASLKDKPHLKELILSCSERDSNEVCTDDSDRIEVVFEDLCPPVQLKILKITNYFGCKLPSWLGSRLFNIRFLKITGCSNCKKLDGLGLLPFLEAFYIEGASSIKNIGPEFYTNNNIENGAYQNSVLFRSMKLLSFENMDSWEEWSSLGKDIRVMPCLEVLQIYACPKLKSIPEEALFHAASYLKRIRICTAPQLLLKKLHYLRFLEIIEIGNIPYLEKISGVPVLRRLKIEDYLVDLLPGDYNCTSWKGCWTAHKQNVLLSKTNYTSKNSN